ncbi:hypothetical protein DPMN_071490 [Dreissena polymorpha]|uniref:Uncharacterized protein n=1 Tax=Dreissena polymorpha TaxID=45954 RepID=A0A9D3Z6S6_DREPO|nr:hypothetical protein DPMN_071490 [Dreissena polymorpha]
MDRKLCATPMCDCWTNSAVVGIFAPSQDEPNGVRFRWPIPIEFDNVSPYQRNGVSWAIYLY